MHKKPSGPAAVAGTVHKPAQASAPAPVVQRQPAPHVQAAIAAAAQPRMPTVARLAAPPAPHVRAAVAQAKEAPRPSSGGRVPAAHVQAALSSTAQPRTPPASPHPAARPVPPQTAAQARPAAPPPARPAPHVEHALTVNQPHGAGVLQRAKRKLESPDLPKRKKRRIATYNEDEIFASLDREIEASEQKDIEAEEKRRQENLKKYENQLKKRPKVGRGRKRTLTYGTGKNTSKVTSDPISKDLMLNAYAKAMTDQLNPTFFYVPTTTLEGSTFEQHFVLRKGHDYVLFPLVPNKDDVYRQASQYGPSFDELAANAEKAALWLAKTFKKTYKSIRAARARVARDVNRMAGDRKPKVDYPLEYLSGEAGLTSFAAVIRADKGRVSKATKYIESILKDSASSFPERFGGEKPTYLGTGKGSGRGPQGLRDKAKEEPGEDSEYSSDEK